MRRGSVFNMAMSVFLVSLLAGWGMIAGCTEGNGDFGNDGFSSSGGSTQDVDDESDAGEADADDNQGDECADVDCDEGMTCVEGECVEEHHGESCEEPESLDVDEEGVVTVTADPRMETEELPTVCDGAADGPPTVFEFSVETETRIETSFEDVQFGVPPVKEMRAGDCGDPEALVDDYADDGCSINPDSFIAQPDTDYFLILRAQEDEPVGEVEMNIDVTPFVCEPGRSCNDGDVENCVAGEEVLDLECIDGCEDGYCLGDTCENPVVVDDSVSFEAGMEAFNNNIDFSDSPSCSSMPSDPPVTNGEDIVYRVEDLMAGDRLEVESPGGEYRIGIMDECSGEDDPQCLAADSQEGFLDWEVEDDGDYLVVYNRMISSTETAEFSIDVVQ